MITKGEKLGNLMRSTQKYLWSLDTYDTRNNVLKINKKVTGYSKENLYSYSFL